MRGTLLRTFDEHYMFGIIPAYAGNTQCAHLDATDPRDHPRVCGEHFNGYVGQCVLAGSSPRMRGTQVLTLQFLHLMGIIPAYAGNTRLPCSHIGWFRDHPRVCGEHTRKERAHHLARGSSPRMRGTPGKEHVDIRLHGIIPAYAGNTFIMPFIGQVLGDHPRVCGEHWSWRGRR